MHGVELEPGHCYGACGLWTQKKQRDLSPCDPRLRSCNSTSWAKEEMVWLIELSGTSLAVPTLWIKWLEGHLPWAWRVLAPSLPQAHHHMPDYHHHRLIHLVRLAVANWFHLRCWIFACGSIVRRVTWRRIMMSGLLHRKIPWSILDVCPVCGER